jgi:type III restriction enzyme
LRDKKKLLSFESPTRFIFSIWALQEGWDNPNVFTICKLSNQGSEISKLQQIGRGLRICVNQDLKRQTIQELADNQEEFWKINNLDVVVSNKEQGFVEAIQNEILNNSFFIPDTFTEQELKKVLKEKNNFDDITVRHLLKLLDNKEIIVFKQTVDGQDIYEKSAEFFAILKNQDLPQEHFSALESLFATDYKNFIQEKSKIRPKKKVVIKASHLSEFKKLWETISKNADFVIENLNKENEEQLIINIKNEVEKLNIDEILLQTTREEIKVDKIGESDAVYGKVINTESQKNKVDYLEFVRNLSNINNTTKIPLLFTVKIFNALSNEFKENTLAKNPAQTLKEIKEIIRKNLVNLLKAKVRYNGIENSALPNVFKTENGETYLDTGSVGKFQKDIDRDFSLKTKWVFENVIEYDSDFEVEIIEKDTEMDEIEIFGKLPKLKIKTPLGEYNPDFCYAIKGKNGNKIFLIVESKGYSTSTSIPESEKGKIAFAEKYFEALNDFYQNENIKISFKERINTTQLANLIII